MALENGVDTIEHGAKPDEEILRLFRERGAAQVATLSAAVPYARFDRSVSKATEMEQYNGEVVLEGIIECAKACLAAGIPVGLGTDTGCPYITHYDMWREVRYFHTFCGVSNAFALHTATLGNAKIAGIDGITGSLTPGKSADLIVTAGNPLEDLETLRHVSMVTTVSYTHLSGDVHAGSAQRVERRVHLRGVDTRAARALIARHGGKIADDGDALALPQREKFLFVFQQHGRLRRGFRGERVVRRAVENAAARERFLRGKNKVQHVIHLLVQKSLVERPVCLLYTSRCV